jgi:hypothetical protein
VNKEAGITRILAPSGELDQSYPHPASLFVTLYMPETSGQGGHEKRARV